MLNGAWKNLRYVYEKMLRIGVQGKNMQFFFARMTKQTIEKYRSSIHFRMSTQMQYLYVELYIFVSLA